MNWGMRSIAMAAGAAALLSAQTAVAATPALPKVATVDPLVSLSVLGTAQSRAAVCGATAAAGGTCVLPAAAMAAASASATTAATQDGMVRDSGMGLWVPLLGVVLLIAIMAAVLSGGGDAEGNLNPVSPG